MRERQRLLDAADGVVGMTPLQRGEAASLGVIGTAAFLPGAPVGNAEIAGRSGASLDWISERTGVMTRHIAMPDERTSDLAAAAGQLAMADTQVRPDMLVLATVTADQPVPATACVVQDRLGIRGTPAVDVNAACSGFIYALVSAWGASCVGVARSPLVIGADAFTRFVDPTDRRTAPLFGDGAGAVMLGPVPQGYGILAADLWADGSRADLAVVPPPQGSFLRILGSAWTDALFARWSWRWGRRYCRAPWTRPASNLSNSTGSSFIRRTHAWSKRSRSRWDLTNTWFHGTAYIPETSRRLRSQSPWRSRTRRDLSLAERTSHSWRSVRE